MDGDSSLVVAEAVQASHEAPPVSLSISVCSGRGWAGQFGYSLASMALHLGFGLGDSYAKVKAGLKPECPIRALNIVFSRQANICASRNEHIVNAIKEGHTHLLSLDDDMTFPHDAVFRMLKHRKPILVANYRKKVQDKVECVCSGLDGNSLSSEGKTGLELIRGFGMGLTLIDLRAIAHIPPPYFAVVWNKANNTYMIEDAIFAAILAEHKIEAWVDHDLSQSVGHVGDYEYRLTPLPPVAYPNPALVPASAN